MIRLFLFLSFAIGRSTNRAALPGRHPRLGKYQGRIRDRAGMSLWFAAAAGDFHILFVDGSLFGLLTGNESRHWQDEIRGYLQYAAGKVVRIAYGIRFHADFLQGIQCLRLIIFIGRCSPSVDVILSCFLKGQESVDSGSEDEAATGASTASIDRWLLGPPSTSLQGSRSPGRCDHVCTLAAFRIWRRERSGN